MGATLWDVPTNADTDLYQRLNKAEQLDIAQHNFRLWAEDFGKLGDTKQRPTFEFRPWLEAIYRSWARHLVIRKANQVGISAFAILRAVWGASFHWPLGVMYFLPHQTDVGDFVRQKLDPVLEELPDAYAPTKTANVGMKSLAMGDLFLRGIAARGSRQSGSADTLILDERDDMEQEHIDDALNRLAASAHKNVIEISRPSAPGYGIDLAYQDSSQNLWELKCQHCAKGWFVEESWPTCVQGEGTKLVCPKCRKPASVLTGRWVAKDGDNEIEGYSVNGLLNPHAELKDLWAKYEKNEGIFNRASLGLPFLEKGAGVTAKMLLKMMEGGEPQQEAPTALRLTPVTFLGSDVGDQGHVIILEKRTNAPKEKPRLIRARRWTNWSDLHRDMRVFKPRAGVVDAMPEKRNAREFCQAFRGRAFMCYYDNNRKGSPKWDERNMTLNIDRTESLDQSHTPLYNDGVALARADEEMRVFAQHCENLVRITEELPDGNIVAKWIKRGEDHYRHAFNYAWASLSRKESQLVAY